MPFPGQEKQPSAGGANGRDAFAVVASRRSAPPYTVLIQHHHLTSFKNQVEMRAVHGQRHAFGKSMGGAEIERRMADIEDKDLAQTANADQLCFPCNTLLNASVEVEAFANRPVQLENRKAINFITHHERVAMKNKAVDRVFV